MTHKVCQIMKNNNWYQILNEPYKWVVIYVISDSIRLEIAKKVIKMKRKRKTRVRVTVISPNKVIKSR